MTGPELLNRISVIISGYFSQGLIPDNDTINFIQSAYGISDTDEIASLIEAGDDGGAVTDLASYPPDSFRESVEELIPADGLSAGEIKSIENFYINPAGRIFIMLHSRKVFLTIDESLKCHQRFVKRLNLDIKFNYFTDSSVSAAGNNFYTIRSLLRKKKFIPNDEKSLFMNDLISRYRQVKTDFSIMHRSAGSDETQFSLPATGSFKSPGPNNQPGLIDLVNAALEILSSPENRPIDILTEKKYYYENAVNEAEEFTQFLKTYSMDFIMSKRMQPPLISIDEARRMIRMIDRLTSIVYGMVIPSVRNVYEEF